MQILYDLILHTEHQYSPHLVSLISMCHHTTIEWQAQTQL